jgi:hypothetical protein
MRRELLVGLLTGAAIWAVVFLLIWAVPKLGLQ